MSFSAGAVIAKGWATVMRFIAPYLGYVALAAIGAFGVVLYLYADEKEKRQETAVDLAAVTAERDLIKQQYAFLRASSAALEAQVDALDKERANAQEKFDTLTEVATERYTNLREQQRRLATMTQQHQRLELTLSDAQASLNNTREIASTPAPKPVEYTPTDKEIADAVCNTTSFSEPVSGYLSDRLQSIYKNGVSLSNPGN